MRKSIEMCVVSRMKNMMQICARNACFATKLNFPCFCCNNYFGALGVESPHGGRWRGSFLFLVLCARCPYVRLHFGRLTLVFGEPNRAHREYGKAGRGKTNTVNNLKNVSRCFVLFSFSKAWNVSVSASSVFFMEESHYFISEKRLERPNETNTHVHFCLLWFPGGHL